MLEIPRARSAYRKDCVDGTDQSVYGRESRVPIHDAIYFVVHMTNVANLWSEGIGLCVENGKLCVIYNN